MDSSPPASIPKGVTPFLARAKELSSRDAVMAYWCKFKAAQLALDQIPSDPEGRNFLEALMDDLESTKANMADNDFITDDIAGSAYISNFASKVFEGADETDRSGKATRLTAKEFLAASTFFELLSIFGPLETDVSEKITYAKWKATSIAKAFREGRVPTPGPANSAPEPTPSTEDMHRQQPTSASMSAGPSAEGDFATKAPTIDLTQDDQISSSDNLPSVPFDADEQPSTPPFDLPSSPSTKPGATRSNDLPAPPAFPTEFNTTVQDGDDDDDILPSAPPFDPSAASASATPARPPVSAYIPPPAQPPSQPRQPPSVSRPSAPPAPASQSNGVTIDNDDDWQPAPSNIDPVTIATAQKHAKWAISALNYEDLETAKKELRAALQLIGG